MASYISSAGSEYVLNRTLFESLPPSRFNVQKYALTAKKKKKKKKQDN
jgi:hypothetical protein